MDQAEAQEKWRRADELCKLKQYDEALDVLDELSTAFPDNSSISYARAVALAGAQRSQEALQICRTLVEQHGHANARNLMARLQAQKGPNQEAPQPIRRSVTEQFGCLLLAIFIGGAFGAVAAAALIGLQFSLRGGRFFGPWTVIGAILGAIVGSIWFFLELGEKSKRRQWKLSLVDYLICAWPFVLVAFGGAIGGGLGGLASTINITIYKRFRAQLGALTVLLVVYVGCTAVVAWLVIGSLFVNLLE